METDYTMATAYGELAWAIRGATLTATAYGELAVRAHPFPGATAYSNVDVALTTAQDWVNEAAEVYNHLRRGKGVLAQFTGEPDAVNLHTLWALKAAGTAFLDTLITAARAEVYSLEQNGAAPDRRILAAENRDKVEQLYRRWESITG